VDGPRVTETGVRFTVAEADLVLSAALVAVTVIVCDELMLDGAVYKPAAEILPTFGFSNHVTDVLGSPVTVAVNCCVCDAERLAVVGPTDTDTLAAATYRKLTGTNI
jgi:hypothetical protein